MVHREGSELEKQYLDILEGGPFHDVPDFPEAHAAAERVAELDTLVAHGREPEATRRLREIQGWTWDQAIDVMRRWRVTTRGRKLALFGWCPKPPPAEPGVGAADHPLRDRELDG